MLGFLFAALGNFPLATFGDLPIPILWCVGAPLLALVWWLLQPWILQGELPVGGVVVALLVLLINLLAAGAVTFPGVVVTALVLVPVAMQLAARHSSADESLPLPPAAGARLFRLPTELRLSRAMAGGLTAAAFALAILCLWTEYQPVLNSRLQMRKALLHMEERDPAAAEQTARAAAAADPCSPEPWRMLAELYFQRFMFRPGAAAWSEFAQAADIFRRRNPEHHAQFFQRGNWHFLAWQRGKSTDATRALMPSQLAAALSAYREAIHRYPNHALYHGQLAWALEASGDHAAAKAAADRAQALDEATPHADQKLAGRRIADWQPSAVAGRTVRLESAEQTIRQLRTGTTRTP